MTQLSLFNDGLGGTIAYSAPESVNNEKIRTDRQVDAVRSILCGGLWWTFGDLQKELWHFYDIHASEAGISARIRDLRKPEFGGHTIDRRKCEGHLYEYRMVR